jgi:hypothetical protein
MQDEVFTIRHNGLYALYGKNGQIVMPFQKQTFKTDSENHLINIRRNNKTLLFNTQTLEYQSELEFDEFPVEFINGFAKINKKGKYGFLSVSGKMITDFEYEIVYDFNEFGFATVQKNEKFGVIERTGKIVIPINFTENDCPKVMNDTACNFENEVVMLIQKDKSMFGVVNSEGDIIIPIQYPFINIGQANDKIIFVQTHDTSWAAYNLKGKQIIKPKYTEIIILNDGWSIMKE